MLGDGPEGARISQIDVSDPANPVVRRTEDLDGYIVDARLTGRTARVVVASYPEALYGPAELRALPSGWLPTALGPLRAHGRGRSPAAPSAAAPSAAPRCSPAPAS